jgi:hypothetical protein
VAKVIERLIARLKRRIYGSCKNAAYGCSGIREKNDYCEWCYVRGLYSRIQYRAWVDN